jgi:hypothetical protein
MVESKPMKRTRGKHDRCNEVGWRPWGLYDHESIPKFSKQAFLEIVNHLGTMDCKKLRKLRERLRDASIIYWEVRRRVDKPSAKWYRNEIETIIDATGKLVELLQRETGTGLSGLDAQTRIWMKRPLRGDTVSGDLESIEYFLLNFMHISQRALPRKGTPGAPEQAHIRRTAGELTRIYQEFSGEAVPLSLDTAQGPSGEEFIYPGPRFVQLAFKGIDPEVKLAEIRTGLRKVLERVDVLGSESEDDWFGIDDDELSDVVENVEQSGNDDSEEFD